MTGAENGFVFEYPREGGVEIVDVAFGAEELAAWGLSGWRARNRAVEGHDGAFGRRFDDRAPVCYALGSHVRRGW